MPSTAEQDYALKDQRYFAHARRDIAPLLPARAERVLEVGCGAGATLAWLKAEGRCGHASGVELFPAAAEQARQQIDRVSVGNAEALIDQDFGYAPQTAGFAPFDLILCLDVLEHMQDPWTFVRKLSTWVHPQGQLIVSLPNVRNLKVTLPLLLQGRWQYADEGILDRTHLRFFTRASAQALLNTDEWQVTGCLGTFPTARSRRANALSLGLASELLALQFLVAARPTATPVA